MLAGPSVRPRAQEEHHRQLCASHAAGHQCHARIGHAAPGAPGRQQALDATLLLALCCCQQQIWRLCKTVHGMFTWELLNRRGGRRYLPCCCGRDSSGALPGRSCGAAARPRAWARWARPCLTPHGSRSSACWWPAHRPAPMAAARTTSCASVRCAPDLSGRALYFLVMSWLFLGRMHGSLVLVSSLRRMHERCARQPACPACCARARLQAPCRLPNQSVTACRSDAWGARDRRGRAGCRTTWAPRRWPQRPSR